MARQAIAITAMTGLLPATVAASFAVAATAVAGGFGPTQIIRTAPPGVELKVRDIAIELDDIAVVWEEDRPTGRKTFLRITSDGGVTFSTDGGDSWDASSTRRRGSQIAALVRTGHPNLVAEVWDPLPVRVIASTPCAQP